ncbi:hypothetical protein K439DRAFT_1616758 [Ramaria rubella]|nr:hypothetical protein K439DRAFT_1616758 [Ramaria rubella]
MDIFPWDDASTNIVNQTHNDGHNDFPLYPNSSRRTSLQLYYSCGSYASSDVKYIWQSSWSFVKCVYLIIRYYAVLYLLVNSFVSTNTHLSVNLYELLPVFCNQYLKYEIWGSVLLVPLVDTLIVTRIYALYNRSLKMGFVLLAMWLGEFVLRQSALVLIVIAFRGADGAMKNPIPGVVPGCQIAHAPELPVLLVAWRDLILVYNRTVYQLTNLQESFFRISRGLCRDHNIQTLWIPP